MSHPSILKKLSPLIDGELDERSSRSLLDHLAACGSCRSEYEKMSELEELSGELGKTGIKEPSPFFESRLKARIEELKRSAPIRNGNRAPVLVAASAMAVFLLIIGTTFGSFAFALGQKDRTVRDKIMTRSVNTIAAKPSVLNLVTIMSFCRDCRTAVCDACSQCPAGGPASGCCPVGQSQDGSR